MMTGIEKQVANLYGLTDAQFEAARTAYLAKQNMRLEQYYSLSVKEIEVIERSGVSSTDYQGQRMREMSEAIVAMFKNTMGASGSDIPGLNATEAEMVKRIGISPEDYIKARGL